MASICNDERAPLGVMSGHVLVIANGATENQLLAAAAAVEAGSDHPLAQAILRRAEKVQTHKATAFKIIEGK